MPVAAIITTCFKCLCASLSNLFLTSPTRCGFMKYLSWKYFFRISVIYMHASYSKFPIQGLTVAVDFIFVIRYVDTDGNLISTQTI